MKLLRLLLAASVATVIVGCEPAPTPASPEPAPPAASASVAPQQFSSVLAMFEEFNDFSAEDNTLEITSTAPLKIRLSPLVPEGYSPEYIKEDLCRAFVYAALRVFMHTDTTSVQITVKPIFSINKNGEIKRELRAAPHGTATVTRAQVIDFLGAQLNTDLNGLLRPSQAFNDTARRLTHGGSFGPPGPVQAAELLGLRLLNQ